MSCLLEVLGGTDSHHHRS